MAAATPLRPRFGGASDFAVFAAVLIVGGLLVYVFAGGREQDVERSAMGSRGLQSVLRDAGLEARYAGFETHRTGAKLFRVLPVLDTDLFNRFERPESDEAYLATGTERDLTPYVLTEKARRLASLVIAPKWTRAARHSGYAHESLLLPARTAAAGLAPLALFRGGMERPGQSLLRFEADGGEGLLYAPQLFPEQLSEGCTPVIDTDAGPLLIRCERTDAPPLWALSDPDLLNTHGLALGDNARIGVQLLTRIADGAPILIDTTTRFFVLPPERDLPQRSWADLARFFSYPLSMAWLGFAALAALLLWRGGVRFGPARRLFDDRLSASRVVSISAKARLLRQAGTDDELMTRHITNRLRRIELSLFGQHRPGAPEVRIRDVLERTDPELAQSFDTALAEVRTTTGDRALDALAAFEREAGRAQYGS